MANLDSLERELEQRQQDAERTSQEVESSVQELDHRITELQNVMDALGDDQVLKDQLAQNLREREGERKSELSKVRDLQNDLEEMSNQLSEFESINENSKAELSNLQAIGENVSEAMGIVAEREAWVNDRHKRVMDLRMKLSYLM